MLFLILMQAKDALRWFHERDHDSLFGCHLATCFYCILLPCIVDVFFFKGSFVWREEPIGWHGTHMIEQQKTCWYGASYKLIIMISLHGLYEGEMRKKKSCCCYGCTWESMGKILPILFMIFLKRRKSHSWCKEATLQYWKIMRDFHAGR